MAETFDDRHFLGSQAVYARIERGEFSSPAEVEAALLDATVDASSTEEGE